MPRYYIDVTDPKGYGCDEEGSDLTDFKATRQKCQGFLPDIGSTALVTAAKVYRAVPLTRLGQPRCDVTVSADSAIAALELAKSALGDGVPFDLCDGTEIVHTHCPPRGWSGAGENGDAS